MTDMHTIKTEFYEVTGPDIGNMFKNHDSKLGLKLIEIYADKLSALNRALQPIDRLFLQLIADFETEMKKREYKLNIALEHEYSLLKENPDIGDPNCSAIPVEEAAYKKIGGRILQSSNFWDVFKYIDLDNPDIDGGRYGEARTEMLSPIISIAAISLLEYAIILEAETDIKYREYELNRLSSHIHYDLNPLDPTPENRLLLANKTNSGILHIAKRTLPLLISNAEIQVNHWNSSRPNHIKVSIDNEKDAFIRMISPSTRAQYRHGTNNSKPRHQDFHYEFRKSARGEPELFSPLIAQMAILCTGIRYGLDNPKLAPPEGKAISNKNQSKLADWVQRLNPTMPDDPILNSYFGSEIMDELARIFPRKSDVKGAETYLRW